MYWKWSATVTYNPFFHYSFFTYSIFRHQVTMHYRFDAIIVKQQIVILWKYVTEFFLEWEIFQTKFVEEIKTHIYTFSNVFQKKNLTIYMIRLKNYGRYGQATYDSIMRCWITNGTDALRTYLFRTATTVTWTRLSVPWLVQCLWSVTHVINTWPCFTIVLNVRLPVLQFDTGNLPQLLFLSCVGTSRFLPQNFPWNISIIQKGAKCRKHYNERASLSAGHFCTQNWITQNGVFCWRCIFRAF